MSSLRWGFVVWVWIVVPPPQPVSLCWMEKLPFLDQARIFSQTCLSEENWSLLLLGKPPFLGEQFVSQLLNLRWEAIRINVRIFA